MSKGGLTPRMLIVAGETLAIGFDPWSYWVVGHRLAYKF